MSKARKLSRIIESLNKANISEGLEKICSSSDSELYNKYDIGDKVVVWIAAPGSGKIVYEVVKKNRDGLFGKVILDTSDTGDDYYL